MTKSNFYFAEVLAVDDDKSGLRIKVKLPYEDADSATIDELPYVFPLLPKLLHINPKVGEMVLVFIQNTDSPKSNRFFIGPIISQPYMLNYDPYNFSARSLFEGKQIDKPLPNTDLNPENKGTLPDREDIAILGRQNNDIILKKDEVCIRCGQKQDPNGNSINTLLFNKVDPSYIQLRYRKYKDRQNNSINSIISIVADRINLLSHDSITNFNLTDREELISDDEMEKIINEAHPVVYGDLLIAFLKQLINLFSTHTHPFPMDPPSFNQPAVEILSTDLNQILSKSIKIN